MMSIESREIFHILLHLSNIGQNWIAMSISVSGYLQFYTLSNIFRRHSETDCPSKLSHFRNQ